MSRRTLAQLAVVPLLVLPLGMQPQAADASTNPQVGRASAPDQKLQHGCHDYVANYRVTIDTNEWSGYVQFYSPRGRKVAGNLIDKGEDKTPRKGRIKINICSQSVVPGRWKVVLKMIWQKDDGKKHYQRSEPTYFRLYR